MNLPYILKIVLTERCNLNCLHCYLKKETKDINIEILVKVLEKEFHNKLGGVCLTGGEPLLHEHFKDIVEYFYLNKIPYCVATNGIGLNKDVLEYLEKRNVSFIQISLEGPNAELNDYLRGKGSFDRVVKNIEYAKQVGIKVIIAFTINSVNWRFVDEMLNFSEDLGVDIRYEIFLPLGNGSENANILLINEAERKSICKKLKEINSRDIKIYRPHLFGSGCGAGINSAVINADLTISACDMLCNDFKSGNSINECHTFTDIWNNDGILKQWRRVLKDSEHYIGCRAVSYAYYGNIEEKDFWGEALEG